MMSGRYELRNDTPKTLNFDSTVCHRLGVRYDYSQCQTPEKSGVFFMPTFGVIMAKNTDNTATKDDVETPDLAAANTNDDAVAPIDGSDVATAPVNSTGYDQATGAFNN